MSAKMLTASTTKIITNGNAAMTTKTTNLNATKQTTNVAATTNGTQSSISSAMQSRRNLLLTVEKLRVRVRQVLKCVINLHIEFLVLESNVSQLLDDVRSINDEFVEVRRLDALIETLRDYDGPTICHEWPYPLIFKGTIDEANLAQILNTKNDDNKEELTEKIIPTNKHSMNYKKYGDNHKDVNDNDNKNNKSKT